MDNTTHDNRMDRRSFLRVGTLGAALVATPQGRKANGAEPSTQPKPPAEDMYRTLGRTGIKVLPIGIGALRTTEVAVLQAAFDLGVNFVDTGRSYQGGKNEVMVGQALEGRREEICVATKIATASKEAMMRDIEESLKALDTDCIDILQLHSVSSADSIVHAVAREVLAEARKQGKARFLGVSCHSKQAEVLDAICADSDKLFDVAMVSYNFKSGVDIKEAIARAAKAGIGIVAMKTQAGGYQTKELGDISPHQAALKWVLQDRNVHTTVPGMANLAQIEEDVKVMHMDLKLSHADSRILERYGDAIEARYCHQCRACEATCPRGVDIPTVNRCLMYAEGYGDLDLARTTYAELSRPVSAAACADCSTCVAQCAHSLNIAQQMRRAQELFV